MRAILLTGAALALIVGGASFLGWLWHPSYDTLKDRAVVTAADTRAFTAASTTSGSVIQLPPGSEVVQLEKRGAWTYVEIPFDPEPKRGWVQSNTMTPLWPDEFDPKFLD